MSTDLAAVARQTVEATKAAAASERAKAADCVAAAKAADDANRQRFETAVKQTIEAFRAA